MGCLTFKWYGAYCIPSNRMFIHCFIVYMCDVYTLLLFKINLCSKSLNKTVTRSIVDSRSTTYFSKLPSELDLINRALYVRWFNIYNLQTTKILCPCLIPYTVYRMPYAVCLMPMHRQTLENVTVAKIAIFHLINKINICCASSCLDRSKNHSTGLFTFEYHIIIVMGDCWCCYSHLQWHIEWLEFMISTSFGLRTQPVDFYMQPHIIILHFVQQSNSSASHHNKQPKWTRSRNNLLFP